MATGAIPGSDKGGLVALWQKCPHLGCTVPWRPDFDFLGSKGWFRCPCHGSTYTKFGKHMAGPANRGLDPLPFQDKSGTAQVTWINFEQTTADRMIVSYT